MPASIRPRANPNASGGRQLPDRGPRTASADGGLEDYLRLLAGQEPAGRLIEIRYTTGPGQMAQRFIDATTATGPPA